MSDDQQFRYNCLELAHRLKPGDPEIIPLAQKFYGFVAEDNTDAPNAYVMVTRDLAERIALENDDVVYDEKNARLSLKPAAEAEHDIAA